MELMIVPRKIPFRRDVIGCVIIGLATPKAILLEYHFVAFYHERSSCCYILALSLIASNFVTFGWCLWWFAVSSLAKTYDKVKMKGDAFVWVNEIYLLPSQSDSGAKKPWKMKKQKMTIPTIILVMKVLLILLGGFVIFGCAGCCWQGENAAPRWGSCHCLFNYNLGAAVICQKKRSRLHHGT